MRWFKHTTIFLLLVAAAAVVLATTFSQHSDDYGQVRLPQGGTVHLPEGTVTVSFKELGQSDAIRQPDATLGFEVVPAGGGPVLDETPTGGGTSEVEVQRSEELGQLGSVAKVEVPAEGDYVVSGSANRTPGTSFLTFGTNPGAAVLDRWRLLAGLLGAALLVALIPVPRTRKHWDDELGQSGWSSDPTAPYAPANPSERHTHYPG
jgi:hypothetical protein